MICAILGVVVAIGLMFGIVWLWNKLDGISWDYTEDKDSNSAGGFGNGA